MAPHKAILVGCGGICRAWIPHITAREDVAIVGLVDLDLGNAETIREKHELTAAAVGTDLAAMIRDTGADVVLDCTVPEAHHPVTTTALDAGCHVLGEKPLADSMAHAADMVRAADDNQRLYAVIQNRRYQPQIIQYRDLLRSGDLGAITTLDADFHIGAHFGGFREAMDHVLLLDMAIHSFDQARFICGKDPVSVYCHEWNPAGSWFRHGAAAVCIFEMTDGVVFTYRGSWCTEGMNTTWECDWRAIATRGSALWDGAKSLRAEVATQSEDDGRFISKTEPLELPAPPELERRGHAGVIHDFFEALRTGTPPQTDSHDNIKSLAMVHAAIESAETGRKVPVPLP